MDGKKEHYWNQKRSAREKKLDAGWEVAKKASMEPGAITGFQQSISPMETSDLHVVTKKNLLLVKILTIEAMAYNGSYIIMKPDKVGQPKTDEVDFLLNKIFLSICEEPYLVGDGGGHGPPKN